jgi:hypothetical protein
MSDEPNRDASGQFVATPAEPLVGRAGVEQAQGYIPMPSESAPKSDANLTSQPLSPTSFN